MEIERDCGAIFEKRKIYITGLKRKESPEGSAVLGFANGKDIYLSPQGFIDGIATYCHEIGHLMGNRLSFQSGLKWWQLANVRSFDEIKKYKISIYLEPREVDYLNQIIGTKENVALSGESLTIANKLLDTFFMGNFHPKVAVLHNVPRKELNIIVASEGCNTLVSKHGDIFARNSRHGRDSELPSYTTEFACLLILENTLKKYWLMSSQNHFTIRTTISPSHQRAKNIISRAFSSQGWRVPSMVDIRKRANR